MLMKAVIFDLDNTLYDAEQYFSGAFAEISEYLSEKYSVNRSEVYKRLMKLWREKTSMYAYLFNDLLDSFNIKNELNNVIRLFNEFNGQLETYPDVIPTIRELKKRDYKLGIITDGNVKRQKRKIQILKIADFFDVVMYTKEFRCRKPSHIPFLKALEKLNIDSQNAFYVADNPKVDFEGAKKVGIRTIRIFRGEFKDIPSNEYIDFEINSLTELLKIVSED